MTNITSSFDYNIVICYNITRRCRVAKVYKKTKNGTTYVYDSVSYWDKDLKQPRSKRKLIGKLDPDTGEIIPTGKKGSRPNSMEPVQNAKCPADSISSLASAPAGCKDAASDSTNPDGASAWTLYEECQRKLLETEAELAKAKSTIAVLTSKIENYKEGLEYLTRLL